MPCLRTQCPVYARPVILEFPGIPAAQTGAAALTQNSTNKTFLIYSYVICHTKQTNSEEVRTRKSGVCGDRVFSVPFLGPPLLLPCPTQSPGQPSPVPGSPLHTAGGRRPLNSGGSFPSFANRVSLDSGPHLAQGARLARPLQLRQGLWVGPSCTRQL